MKLLLNKCYGGWSLNEDTAEVCRCPTHNEQMRYNKGLIALCEKFGSAYISGRYADLKVVEIPEEATDYKITEYDGYETVIFVVDGKLNEK